MLACVVCASCHKASDKAPALDAAREAKMAPGERLALAAERQVGVTTSYDPSYKKLSYPGGDVPMDTGVCSDVVVRAFRTRGIDLQEWVHDDMKANFHLYPHKPEWHRTSPDSNIDHRRVENLRTYFIRKKKWQPLSKDPKDYKPGDIVAWKIGPVKTHIGVVSNQLVPGTQRHEIVHNMGAGTQIEDVLFAWTMTGHYRWY